MVYSVQGVRYLYKYITKGQDRFIMSMRDEENRHVEDEVENYMNACYISAIEALWKIYGFTMECSHTHTLLTHTHSQHTYTHKHTPAQTQMYMYSTDRHAVQVKHHTTHTSQSEHTVTYTHMHRCKCTHTPHRTWHKSPPHSESGKTCSFVCVRIQMSSCPSSREFLDTIGSRVWSHLQFQ